MRKSGKINSLTFFSKPDQTIDKQSENWSKNHWSIEEVKVVLNQSRAKSDKVDNSYIKVLL